MRPPGPALALSLPGADAAPLPGTPARRRRRFSGEPVGGHLAARSGSGRLQGYGAALRGGPGRAGGRGERSAAAPEARARGPLQGPWRVRQRWERGGDGAPGRVGTGASALFAGLQDLQCGQRRGTRETLTNCTEPLKAIEQFQVGLREGRGRRGV